MIEQSQTEKSIKRVNQLLKSKVVYDYMLSLMDVKSFMFKRLPIERKEREVYDKTRPEIRSKNARESMNLSLLIQTKEKAELVSLLKSSNLLRHQVTMIVLIDYGVYVNNKDFEKNLNAHSQPTAYKCGAQSYPMKVPADRIRDYTC